MCSSAPLFDGPQRDFACDGFSFALASSRLRSDALRPPRRVLQVCMCDFDGRVVSPVPPKFGHPHGVPTDRLQCAPSADLSAMIACWHYQSGAKIANQNMRRNGRAQKDMPTSDTMKAIFSPFEPYVNRRLT